MKCACPTCKVTLYIKNENLRKLKTPQFNCPGCQTLIKIRPSVARCGDCNTAFKYYDYKFSSNGTTIVKCQHCQTLNQIKVNY